MRSVMDDPHVVTVDMCYIGRGSIQARNPEYVTSDQSTNEFASVIGCCCGACSFTEFDCSDFTGLCIEEDYPGRTERFMFVRHKGSIVGNE